MFIEGRTDVEVDGEHHGKNKDRVKKLVRLDRRLTTTMIAEELSMDRDPD